MRLWRCAIVVISLGQISAGVLCLFAAKDEVGLFGFAVCLAVGGLGLLTQATSFLRPAAIVANILMAYFFSWPRYSSSYPPIPIDFIGVRGAADIASLYIIVYT